MLDLTSIGAKIEDEDHAIILPSSLPKIYEHFVDTMLYGKQTLTMEEVKATLNSNDFQQKVEMKGESEGEGFTVRGRNSKRYEKGQRGKTRSRYQNTIKCFYCHKAGAFQEGLLQEKNEAS